MLVFCTAVYLFFVLIDIIPIVKNRQWKVLVVYAAIFVAAYVVSALYGLGVKIYSPTYPIKHIVNAIFGG